MLEQFEADSSLDSLSQEKWKERRVVSQAGTRKKRQLLSFPSSLPRAQVERSVLLRLPELQFILQSGRLRCIRKKTHLQNNFFFSSSHVYFAYFAYKTWHASSLQNGTIGKLTNKISIQKSEFTELVTYIICFIT